jgi:hypothetical protein
LLPVRAVLGRLFRGVGGWLLPVSAGWLLPVPAVLGRLFRGPARWLLSVPAVLGRLVRRVARVVGWAGLRHER